jgi:hypothetical protein
VVELFYKHNGIANYYPDQFYDTVPSKAVALVCTAVSPVFQTLILNFYFLLNRSDAYWTATKKATAFM